MPLALALGACDVARPEPPQALGPELHVVGIHPEDGFGAACGSNGADDCGVPTNATLTLRFDRFLNPATVTRQAIRVYTGDPDFSPAIPFEVTYDPVERVVQFHMPSGYAFVANALYQLELLVPLPGDEFGFRAFDGAGLAEAELPIHVSFFTARVPIALPVAEPASCQQIVRDVFVNGPGDCASSQCHRAAGGDLGFAPLGLWLDGRGNLGLTAINHVAHQTELGDAAGVPLQRSPRFGVQMPLIDPQSPGNSYLMYKLLRGAQNFEPCGFDPKSPEESSYCAESADPCVSAYPDLPLPEGSCLQPSSEESERLREWFVRGEPMPIARPRARSVGLQGLRALSRFIAAGADCSE